MGDARAAQGQLDEALELHRRALAIRRERADRHAGFIFVPWELTRSLNSVGELLLAVSPPRTAEAAALFAEARDVGLRALEQAPSFTQVHKQVAVAEEGLARAAIAEGRVPAEQAMTMFKRSAERWRQVVSRSSGDAKSVKELRRIEQRIAQGS